MEVCDANNAVVDRKVPGRVEQRGHRSPRASSTGYFATLHAIAEGTTYQLKNGPAALFKKCCTPNTHQVIPCKIPPAAVRNFAARELHASLSLSIK